MAKKKKIVKEKAGKLSFDLALADCGDVRARLNMLMLDTTKDPLDRFNMWGGAFTEIPKLEHDNWDEVYVIVSHNADIGYLRISKDLQARVATISFYLIKASRHQGVLSEAVQFVGNRVFWELGFNKLRATAWETNGVAISIYERWLKPEGVVRAHGYFEGNYVDLFHYGCLYSESAFQRVKVIENQSGERNRHD